MRFLVVPLSLLIIGLVFLIYVWMARRAEARRKELRDARQARVRAVGALREVKREVDTQVTAYPQLGFLQTMLQEQIEFVTEEPDRKEIAR